MAQIPSPWGGEEQQKNLICCMRGVNQKYYIDVISCFNDSDKMVNGKINQLLLGMLFDSELVLV